MVNVFHCYEFLLLKKLDNDLEFWNKIKENDYSEKDIPCDLWFVAVTLAETKDRFPSFLKKVLLYNPFYFPTPTDTLLKRYLQHHDFVEMHLDSVFKYGDNNSLSKELFKCPNVKVLSLKCNFLEHIPPDIGRLQKLQHLALTNNKLHFSSIPYSLSFCRNLRVLLLDNNLLDALPGFLLGMPSLHTVHRHGNHNYFKATFMWYHTDVNERILEERGCTRSMPIQMQTLKLLSAKAVIAAKINFFAGSVLPHVIVDHICSIYFDYKICYNCRHVNFKSEAGYKVYTFKNPYLGNYCVPFEHYACSMECAEAIEVPAREEQLRSAVEQDREYRKQLQEAHTSTHFRSRSAVIGDSCCIL